MRKSFHSAFRVLSRFRLYTTINIIGLVMSLSCAMIVVRYIYQEITVDHYISTLDRTYILVKEFQNRSPILGGNDNPNGDDAFKDPFDDPAIELFSSYKLYEDNNYISIHKQRFDARVVVTDNNFLKILSYPIYAGKIEMNAPTDAVLTKDFAKLVFGDEDPLGKSFVYSNGKSLKVIGVLDNPSTKTSLHFDVLISSELQKGWGRISHGIARVFPGTDINELNHRNSEYMSLSFNNYIPLRLQFFPLKKFYFDETIEISYPMYTRGNMSNIWILFIVALLLFVIGILNFINIYSVIMLKRSREFGIRKVYGASFGTLFRQIYVENLCMIVISLIMVWAVIEITRGFVEIKLAIPVVSNLKFDILISFTVLLLFPLLTTIYPALKYSRTLTIISIRSVHQGIIVQSIKWRTVFLYIQYVITFTLIVLSFFFMKQLNYMLNADLGYRTKDVIECYFIPWIDWSHESNRSEKENEAILHVLKSKVEKSPLFEKSVIANSPYMLTPYYAFKTDNSEYTSTACLRLSAKAMELFDFELMEGRLWNDSIDRWNQYRLIINETAKRKYKIADITQSFLQPESRLWFSTSEEGMDKNPPYEIVGVVKDFKTNHLSKGDIPIIIVYGKEFLYDPLVATILPGNRKEAVEFLQSLYNELIGEGTLKYSFLDDRIKDLYLEDQRASRIYITFAVIAILISCLGLFGLSLFDIRQQYREIALRKVNGATVKDILPLLIKKYILMLGLAFVFAIPLSYLIIYNYLKNFVYKTPVSWWLFAGAAVVVVFISGVTLAWQIRRAVNVNPVNVLKSE